MEIDRLSASSIKTFVDCPAGWKAKYHITRGPDIVGTAAELGTACHLALEMFAQDGGFHDPHDVKRFELLMDCYKHAHAATGAPPDTFQEGYQILQNFYERTEPFDSSRRIISTEQMKEITLPTAYGDVPFVYVIDRLDEVTHDDGSLSYEVVDYKSGRFRVSPDDLKDDWQARLYAMAVWLEHPEMKGVWVTFDYLRDNVPVSVYFKADYCAETWQDLLDVAMKILDNDGTEERLNGSCRFCIRKHKCDTLHRHVLNGGPLDDDLPSLLQRRYEVDSAIKALTQVLGDVDLLIRPHLEASQVGFIQEGGFIADAGFINRREVDSRKVREMIGDEMYAQYANFGVTSFDRMLKENPNTFDSDQLFDLRKLVKAKKTRATVRVRRDPNG